MSKPPEVPDMIKNHVDFCYMSRPSSGEPRRYVFQDKVCLGLSEALTYIARFPHGARYDEPLTEEEGRARSTNPRILYPEKDWS